jgi:hypothetical protein
MPGRSRANFLGTNFAMNKGRKGRSPDQIRKDRAEVARLYLKRWTQVEIGAKLGLSRQQIGYDLEAVRQEWLQSSLMDFNARRAEELARIDRLERDSWDAWEATKKGKETTTSEHTKGGHGERVKAAIRKVEQAGDPRYLTVVQWCVEQRCRLLGLHAPHKVAPAASDGDEAPLIQIVEVVLSNGRADGAPANLLEHRGPANAEAANCN